MIWVCTKLFIFVIEMTLQVCNTIPYLKFIKGHLIQLLTFLILVDVTVYLK